MSPAEFLARLSAGFSLLGYRIPRILADPRAYPRETMILAVIAAVAIITAVMAALLVREWMQARAVRARLRLRRRPADTARRLLSTFAVFALVGISGAVLPMLPVGGAACAVCHVPGTAADAWRHGPHSSVGCYACHARPGVTGAVEATLRGGGALIGGVPRPVTDSGSCIGCHERVAAVTVVSDGIRVSHVEIVDAGLTCVSCHPNVGHGEPVDPTKSIDASGAVVRSVMNRCVACHDGVRAPAECSVCHPNDPSDRPGEEPVAITQTGTRCDGCHSPATSEKCVACHGLEMPHPDEFQRRHAQMSAADPGLCASCHEEANPGEGCSCHPEPNLHGTYSEWFPRHGPIASVNGRGGCGCHDAEFCGMCHDDDPFE